jgi:hypothetical protein
VLQAPTRDVARDGQSERESECKKPSRQRWGFEILIDRVQLTRREKWEIKVAKRGDRKQRPRIKYPESPLGKMLKYWDDHPRTKGKRNKE